jgi:hypothetical protein
MAVWLCNAILNPIIDQKSDHFWHQMSRVCLVIQQYYSVLLHIIFYGTNVTDSLSYMQRVLLKFLYNFLHHTVILLNLI